ncbi:VOC family protein [Sphingobacterium suaedae]|uniref:VOC family protein n=1 Tax=Sphingobacterium suaedae TaxID=1686402 RepID=A0ABW5KE51_9SPHI
MRTFKPDGYQAVSPYLVMQEADQLIDLIERVFGGRLLRRFDRPDGKVLHGEVKLGDSVIMFAEANTDYPPIPALLHAYVADVDAVYQKALAYGCEGLETPVRKEGELDKRGMFRDFAGNMWSVATQEEQTS